MSGPATAAGAPPAPAPDAAHDDAPDDGAWRATWEGLRWSAVDRARVDPTVSPRLSLLFVDDRRLAAICKQPTEAMVFQVSRRMRGDAASRAALWDPGSRGFACGLARLSDTEVALSSAHEVWRWPIGSRTGAVVATETEGTRSIEWLAVDPETRRAVVTGERLALRLFPLDAPGAQASLVGGPDGEAYGLAFCGRRLVDLRRRDPRSGALVLWTFDPTTPGSLDLPAPNSLAVHPREPLAAVGLSGGGRLLLCDLRGAAPAEVGEVALGLRGVGSTLRACAFGGGRLWATTDEGLWSWSLDAAALLSGAAIEGGHAPAFRALPARFGTPYSLVVSPDGTLVAVGSGWGHIWLRGVDAP